MKYVLIKHKTIKLLVDEKSDAAELLKHLKEIHLLNANVQKFYSSLLTATTKEADQLEIRKLELSMKIGYKIIGVPFTNNDAELYALDKNLDYTILELAESDI